MTNIDQNEDDIRARAYKLWQEAGSPEGRRDEFWHLAQIEVGEKAASISETTKSGDDIIEAAGGHYPPTGDSQNFA